ncbi:MAG: hypothetical protein WBN96_05440 [Gammaproteobacteria bacterium]
MDWLAIVIVAIFLPLFPLSMGFNLVFSKLQQPLLRITLLVIWPLAGLVLANKLELQVAPGLLIWALLSSALYALRMLALREMNLWISFMATSVWALLWIPLSEGYHFDTLWLDAMGFSTPLIALVIVAELLRRRFGAAYADIYGGLAHGLPRLAMVMVMSVLAAIATPVFPGFFTMLSILMIATPATIVSLLLIWLLWSWAGIRLLHGFIFGDHSYDNSIKDIPCVFAWSLLLLLIAIAVVGVIVNGALL